MARQSRLPKSPDKTPFCHEHRVGIKSAIELLSLEERATLIAELCGRVDDDWDQQMSADAAVGKFERLNEDAESLAGDKRSDAEIRAMLETRLQALTSGQDRGMSFEGVFGEKP